MSHLVGKYVILKSKFWDTEIRGTVLDRNKIQDPDSFSRMTDTDFVSKGTGQIHELTPRIGYVTEFQNGKVLVQTSFYFARLRHGDYEVLDPSMLTTFKVLLRPDLEPPFDTVLGFPDDRNFGEIVDDTTDPDNEMFYVSNLKTGETDVISSHKLIFIEDELYNQVMAAAPLLLVSKDGFLPSQVRNKPIPKNIESVVFSHLSGLPTKYTPARVLQMIEERLWGLPQTIRRPPLPEPNLLNGLEAAPLPYGPQESNFMGGRRKSSPSVGTMARRGTRRSGGIFSRIYSPVGHLFSAGKESVGAVTNTAKGVVGEGIKGLDKIGRSVSTHANQAVRNVFTRKGGKRRAAKGSRKSRKSRRTTRRRR
jgi:hypothetical protein